RPLHTSNPTFVNYLNNLENCVRQLENKKTKTKRQVRNGGQIRNNGQIRNGENLGTNSVIVVICLDPVTYLRWLEHRFRQLENQFKIYHKR
ncbi:17374_t:CDS:2, partial [Dentiscutata heterogama]